MMYVVKAVPDHLLGKWENDGVNMSELVVVDRIEARGERDADKKVLKAIRDGKYNASAIAEMCDES